MKWRCRARFGQKRCERRRWHRGLHWHFEPDAGVRWLA